MSTDAVEEELNKYLREEYSEENDNPPTIREECPDCGGEVLVWITHSGDVGMTQSVVHIPPDRE